jgi:hypothetical protein
MIAAYTRNPNWWSNGIKACAPYVDKLQFFCLDIETDPGVRVTAAMVQGVTALGVRSVIYSGYGMWPEVMGGDVTSFSAVPLWDTNVVGSVPLSFAPNIGSPPPVQYGGWNTAANPRVGIQQGFDVSLNGVVVDVSSFSLAFLAPGPTRACAGRLGVGNGCRARVRARDQDAGAKETIVPSTQARTRRRGAGRTTAHRAR